MTHEERFQKTQKRVVYYSSFVRSLDDDDFLAFAIAIMCELKRRNWEGEKNEQSAEEGL